jgi:hypothetical protein
MRFSTSFTIIAALTLSATDPSSVKAQTAARPGSVVVAVFKDYPAFRPSNRTERGRELQALVIPTDYTDKDRSVIILNPEYATPQVLFAAITRLNSMPAAWQENTIFTITSSNRALTRALDPTVTSALAGAIQELLATSDSKLRGHPSAKHITLAAELRTIVANAQTGSNP